MLMVFTDGLPEAEEEFDRRLNQRRKPRPGARSPCGPPHLGGAGVCTRCRFLGRQPGEPLLAIGLHRGGRGCAYVPAGSAPLDFILVLQEGGQFVWDNVITMTGSEVLDSQESVTKFYCRNLGITSLAKSSIERNTLECSMLPKDMLAPKYPMPCSSRNLVILCTHCSGVPK